MRRRMFAIDATCPLVTKVHREAMIHAKRGRHVLLVGHAGHPEVVGTMGQLPRGTITLIETLDDVATLDPPDPDNLAFVTQTTLSVDDTAQIVAALQARFPKMIAPHKEDICYATTNRQEAVKKVAPMVDAMIVVGSPNSSNSQRLREVAERAGCPLAMLVNRGEDIDWTRYGAISTLGITAGASAPEVLVEEIIDAFRSALRRHRRDGDQHGGRRVLSPAARIARRRCGVSRGGLYGSSRGRALRFRGAIRDRRCARLQGYRRGRREHELLSPHLAGRFHSHAL